MVYSLQLRTPQGTSIYTETSAIKTCQTGGREVRSVSEADARRDKVAELVAVLRRPGATPYGEEKQLVLPPGKCLL